MYDGEGSAWRGNYDGELAYEILARAILAASAAEIDMPHVVVCLDEETGAASYSGPFPDALDALAYAERESALDRALNDGAPMRFSVAALYPTSSPGPG
jgi:hypothetical protein